MRRIAVLIACLAAGLALAAHHLSLPDVQPTTAPAAAFSAERAMNDVRALSQRPRPTGSVEAARARDHLLTRLSALGGPASVQRTTVVQPRGLGEAGRQVVVGGEVENVVGVLPGTDRRAPAVLLMSHYDSVPNSPGAADDAIGVAATLEVARALRSAGTQRRDVILLFTDGEEVGLFGARAFFAEHPLSRRVGTVINLEARGSSGPAVMFQTGARNGALVDLFARSVERPSANSLTGFVYALLPNDTDFTVPLRRDLPGFNIAIVADQQDYHSPSATLANLDRGSLQHMGDQALSLARALADDETAAPRTADAVYFDAPFSGLIRYPPWGGWIVLAAGAGLWALGTLRARRGGAIRWSEVGRGGAAFLFLVAATALVLLLARQGLSTDASLAGLRRILVQFPLYEAGLALLAAGVVLLAFSGLVHGARLVWAMMLALGLLAWLRGGGDLIGPGLAIAAAVLGVFAFRKKGGEPLALWSGMTLAVLLLAAAAQVAAPQAAFLLAWPGALAALGFAIVATDRRGIDGKGGWGALMLGVLAFAWLATFGHMVLVTLGAETPAALAPIAALSALLLFPALAPAAARSGARRLALLAMVVGAACLIAVALRDPWTPRSPQASQQAFLADPARSRFLRFSVLPQLDAWSARALAADGGQPRRGPLPEAFAPRAWQARSRPVVVSAVQPVLTRSADGRVSLTVPRWSGRELRLTLRSSAAVSAVTVQGRPAALLTAPGAESRLRWTGAGPVTVAFTPSAPGTLHVAATVIADGLPPGLTEPTRPADVAAWGQSGTTLTVGRVTARF